MKKIFLLVMSFVATIATAQVERPKLVVGIVVDQMRWDYLYRYQARYCDGGFKRLLNEGFSCENTLIPYIPSVTAIGHTSIYTGSVPSIHGIAGNYFFIDGKEVYCTDDSSVESVGSNGKAGKMSPVNLWSTTIGDELRAATNNRSKVIGVSIKDRASILPAGRNADAAYWFDSENGCFVTSTYYMDKLPKWAEKFNKLGKVDEYLSKKWETLYPMDTYKESTVDETVYEDDLRPGVKATLPLDLKTLSRKYGKGIIKETPFGIDLTFDMARATMEGENFGLRGETDFLAISCSSTDIIGHQVGIRAIEIEDTYLRLDKAIANFLSYLDNRVGKGNYLVFLSADHGAMDNAQYLLDNRTPAGAFSERQTKADINKALREKFNISQDLVARAMNFQVFFDLHTIDSLSLDYEAVKAVVVETLKRNPEVLYACDMEKTSNASIPEIIRTKIINGYNRQRSGGVQVVTRPGYYYGSMKGTTHGMWNPYDTHIPLVFMGWGIKHGASTKEYHMTDIAPTIAALLHIQAPNGSIGEPIF